MFRTDLLSGKKILITGGGSGLGLSFALRMAELGAQIVICGRREGVLAEAVEKIQAAGSPTAERYVCDIRDPAAVERMFDQIWESGPLTTLLNNAAGNFIARTETLSARAIDSILGIVLHGTFYCTTAAGRRWIAGGHPGTVLSIVSAAADTGRAFAAPSAAAKAGVQALMRSLAVEWGPHGIRTVSIAPGLFPTKGAWDRLFPEGAMGNPEEMEMPLRRVGQHIEIANLACYLVSQEAGFITGDTVNIDGGRTLMKGGSSGISGLFSWKDEEWEAHRRNATSAKAG